MQGGQPDCPPQLSDAGLAAVLYKVADTQQAVRPALLSANPLLGDILREEGSCSPPDSQPLPQDVVLVVDLQAAVAAHEVSHDWLRHAEQPGAGTEMMLCVAQVAGPAWGPLLYGLCTLPIAIHKGNLDVKLVQVAEGCELWALPHAAQAHRETSVRCQQLSACSVHLAGGTF